MVSRDEPTTAAKGRALRVLDDWREVDLQAIQARRSGDQAAADVANKKETQKRNELREAADKLRRRSTDTGGKP